MTLKNKFLKYDMALVTAEQLLRVQGPNSAETVKAFEDANTLKREILDRIDELEDLVNT